jgi:hypothetical protein
VIDIPTAAKLLDFSTRIGKGQRADEQLHGAVAIHNLLSTQGVAYLADEVGMGKTYVALGAMALFRHFQPDFRVLIIAPRKNIQAKWMKELRNFVANNVKFSDMRVKSLDGFPSRPLVDCDNLLALIRELSIDRNRDFFLRLSSFSLPVSGKNMVDPDSARRLRDGMRRYLPWLNDNVFDLRNRKTFKDNIACAICCALPVFDLVIVDEGHNLKHGFGENVSARNRVLGLAMGHPEASADERLFPGFGPRAKRVLFLSATPIEETYTHLWNQLNVFGLSKPYGDLLKTEIDENKKKSIAANFLIRRVTTIKVGNKEYTKNLYRREWRRGGVKVHDEPIRIDDARQRLVVALVQKKVSELLGHERFNSSFQIGMLASFESFLETTRLKKEIKEVSNFDDLEQTDATSEREGIDVLDVNRLANSYRRKFGVEMPHPKMDALVDSLSDSWTRGEKTLIFVRRVASVKELKRKLEERYDEWLQLRLISQLPTSLVPQINKIFEDYKGEKQRLESKKGTFGSIDPVEPGRDGADQGGYDTFFAWFFRGEGPRGVVSGANIQQRFIQKGTAYSTFFEDNYVASVLECKLGDVESSLTKTLGVSSSELRSGLRDRSRHFLPQIQKFARGDRYEAVQAAAIEWLKECRGKYQQRARTVWHERFESSRRFSPASIAPDIGGWLELPTFFTELRKRPLLRKQLWPELSLSDYFKAFRDQELRAQLLASAARLGHGLIDLYITTIARLGSIELRVQESGEEDSDGREISRINDYLDLLETQMNTPIGERQWGAFDELAEIAANFNLIIDVNLPDALNKPLSETARLFGQLLRQQQPVGGMSGQVNQTLVRQFRMPGYPLVLITTDLLQEGEDLHTFCSAVHHYGISWTPSSMEQRIGRIDRVQSLTERRLSDISSRQLTDVDKLQVYYPHLEDTVEILQVHRVLERMNTFMRLMHEGLTTAGKEDRSINIKNEFARCRQIVPRITKPLHSAFPILSKHLGKDEKHLATDAEYSEDLKRRFAKLKHSLTQHIDILWDPQYAPSVLMGTARLGKRIQPFTLLLKSVQTHVLIRCISPVGCIGPDDDPESIVSKTASSIIKIGAIITKEDRTYDLTVEGDVLLPASNINDALRVGMLINHVVRNADIFEQVYLPGHDEPLDTFRHELVQEGNNGS